MGYVDGDDQIGLLFLKAGNDHDDAHKVEPVISACSRYALVMADLAEGNDNGYGGAIDLSLVPSECCKRTQVSEEWTC